ncbi:MAG: PAS domain S-box protein [Gemmatimonadetes bacterium]|nr:PAS domain S-box protein [Gemmatimonadota bacterium]
MVSTLEAVNLLLIGQALLSVFLAALFWAFHFGLRRHRFFFWWAWAWSALAFRLLVGLSAHLPALAAAQVPIELVSLAAGFVLIPLLVFGAQSIRKPEEGPYRRWALLLVAAAVLAVLNYAWARGFEDMRIAGLLRVFPRQAITGVALIFCGQELMLLRRRRASGAAGMTALAWSLWGVSKLVFAAIALSALLERSAGMGFLSIQYQAALDLRMSFIDTAFQIGIAMAMLFLLLEEQQRAERELAASEERYRRSEERFRLLIEKSSDIITILEADGSVRYASPSVAQTLGYDPDDLVGRAVFEFMHPDDHERIVRTFAEGIAVPGFDATTQLRFRCKDGSYRSLEAVGKNLLQDPLVAGVVITARDITERLRAEAALRESDERYRAFIRNSSEGIWRGEVEPPMDTTLPEGEQVAYLGRHTRLAESNDAFAQMYGLDKAGDFVGTWIWEVHVPSPENEASVRAFVRSGYRQLEAVSHELDARGREKYFLNSRLGIVEDGRLVRIWGTQRDITERRRVEAALRESDERYRAFIQQSSEGIWRDELDWPMDISLPEEEQIDYLLAHSHIAEANDAMARMYGMQAASELVGRPLSEFLDPADRVNREYLRRYIRSGYRLADTVSHEVDAEGREKYFLNNRIGIVEDGRLVRIWGTQRDVTERERAEEALAEQRAFLRQIIDLNPNFILARDREGRFRLGNQAAASAYGTTVEDLLGKSDYDFPHDPKLVEYFLAQDREVLETGREVFVPEELIRDVDNNWRWVQTSKRLIKAAGGGSDMVLIVTTDITERKKAEEARERIFTLSLDMLATGNLEGHLTRVNPAFERTLGFTAEELVSRPYLDLVHPDDREATVRSLRAVGHGEAIRGFENRFRCKDDSYRWLAWSCTPPENGVVYVVARDVTEQKLIEEARAFERDLWHNLMDNIPDMIYFKDTESRFTRVNRAQARLLGLGDPAEAIGRSDSDFFDGEHARATLADEQHIVQTGEPMIGKVERARTPGGDVQWFYSTKVAVRDRDDRIIGIVGSSRKMTDLVVAQEALRASEERYRALYDDNPSMHFTLTADAEILSLNRFGAVQLGYGVDELVGGSARRVVHEDDQAMLSRKLRDCLKHPGAVSQWEARMVRRDGSVLWVEQSARAVRHARGETVVLIVCEDITQSKRVEAEQRKLRADVERAAREWRHTFDAISSPVLILDSGGVVTRLNDAARRLAGKDYDRILGVHVGAVGASQPWQRAADLVATVRARHAGASVQVRDEATERVWDVSASPMTVGAGGEEHIIIVAHDITQLVRLQESLRRSETMSAMGSLVAGVAHEVRNPLFSMSATLDAFEARYGVRKEYQKHLGVLRGQLERLTSLMQELLEYGKPPSLDLAPDSIESVLTQAIEACALPARQAKVRFVRKLDTDLPPVAMDRMRLVQLFANLFENAVQHSPPGGTVTVEARVEDNGEGRWIECAVLDGGPGLAAEDIPRIFEPFFTRRRGGTGLGLSLVQRIAEQHGGTVLAGNRPEGGAEVRVRLPLTPELAHP